MYINVYCYCLDKKGCIFFYKSNKQYTIVLFTGETEYVTLTASLQETLYEQVKIFESNQGATVF